MIKCLACGRAFEPSGFSKKFCTPECRSAPAPAIYRYVCPDRRSYVGVTTDAGTRDENGIFRFNSRLVEAFKKYPSETWDFEVLERLPPGCPKEERRKAEQRHIDRLRTQDPKFGFNIHPAIWKKRTYLVVKDFATEADGLSTKFMLLSELRYRLPISFALICRMIERSELPRPKPVNGKLAWIAREVHAWMNELKPDPTYRISKSLSENIRRDYKVFGA